MRLFFGDLAQGRVSVLQPTSPQRVLYEHAPWITAARARRLESFGCCPGARVFGCICTGNNIGSASADVLGKLESVSGASPLQLMFLRDSQSRDVQLCGTIVRLRSSRCGSWGEKTEAKGNPRRRRSTQPSPCSTIRMGISRLCASTWSNCCTTGET